MINTTTILLGGAIAGLLILSAFFSGSETALTAASQARMHHLAREGDRRAKIVTWLYEQRESFIGAILLGNNAVNILASALATSLLIQLVGDAGVAYATLGMTLLIVIFSELLPKSYAINNADRMALRVAPTIRALVWVLAPLNGAIVGFVRLLLRLFGNSRDRRLLVSAADEIRGAINLHSARGAMVKHERDMIESVLDLSEVSLGDVMVHRRNIFALDAGQPPAAIVEEIFGSPHTRIPLWKDNPDNVVGVLKVKEALRALNDARGDPSGLDVVKLADAPWFVPETTSLRHQLMAFRRRRMPIALVVDEYGSLMGLVTLVDILEQIVGDLADESEEPVPDFRRLSDGRYLVSGTASVRDLNRELDWRLPEEEATTIAGLLINEAQVIPEVGQTFVFFGFTFEVLRRQRNQVTALHVTPPPAEAADSAESP